MSKYTEHFINELKQIVENLNTNPEKVESIGAFVACAKFDYDFIKHIICGIKETWVMDKAIQVISDTWNEYLRKDEDICYIITYTKDYSIETDGVYEVKKPLMKIPKFLDIEKSLSEIKESELNRREVNSMYEKRIEEKENNNNQVVTDLEKVSKEIKNASCSWDDSMDYIFNRKVKPQEIEKSLKNTIPNSKLMGRPQHYVSYRILKELRYISSDTTEKDYLRWINLHFNSGWSNDDALKFRMNNKKEFDKLHPSKWKSINTKSNIEKQYYNYAIRLKNTFTKTLEHGKEVDNSELFEHLKDRPIFLIKATLIFDKYLVNDEDYINNGK